MAGRVVRWGLRGVVLLAVVAAAGGLWFREELKRLHVVNTLFAPEKIVHNFSHMGAGFLTAPVPRGDLPVTPVPAGAPLPLPAFVAEWADAAAVTGLLVIDRGLVVHESYRLGTAPEDLRISWSIAKSFISALVGLSLEAGEIGSLDDPVTAYAPEMTGTAYDGATVRDLLQMSTGVRFDEDYLDPRSDINRMGRVIALGGTLDGFASRLTERDRAPGTAWHYVSIDTHVLGMVLRGATGRSVADLMSERIVAPLGLEAEPYYLTDGEGVAFVLGGLNLRLRDYGRFGMMIAQGGEIAGRQVVPEAWLAESLAPSAKTAPEAIRYGYHWWVPRAEGARAGEVLARGVYGQYIYIDRVRQTVIVATAANLGFREAGAHPAAMLVFRALSDALAARG